MHERLIQVRKEHSDFDKNLVDNFAKRMPKLLNIMIDGELYDNHIGSKEVAMLAEPYITNNKGEHIGFHWDYETVQSALKSYIDLDDAEFYLGDAFVWANVKYGDMAHITSDTGTILKYALSELSDKDFPYYPASERAYCWLKKHIELEEDNK